MRKTKSFQSVRYQYFYPELKRCPHCRQRLCLLQGLYLNERGLDQSFDWSNPLAIFPPLTIGLFLIYIIVLEDFLYRKAVWKSIGKMESEKR